MRSNVIKKAATLFGVALDLHEDIEQIKAYLQSEMIRTNQAVIKAGIFRIRLQNSPRSLIIRDMEAIPSEFKEEIHEWKV